MRQTDSSETKTEAGDRTVSVTGDDELGVPRSPTAFSLPTDTVRRIHGHLSGSVLRTSAETRTDGRKAKGEEERYKTIREQVE